MGKLQIGNRQFIIMTAILTIGDSMLVLPFVSSKGSEQDAWLSFILGTIIGIVGILIIATLAKLLKKGSLVELTERVLGRWLALPLILLFLLYIFFTTTAHVREIADFMTTQIMPDTPIHAIIFLTLAAALYGARQGIEVLARSSEIFFPWMLFFFTLIFVLLTGSVRSKYFLPILEHGFPAVIKGAIPASAFPYMELCIFLMLIPFVKDKQKITQNLLTGAAIGGAIIFFMVLLSIGVLGPFITSTHIYPSYALAKKIDVGNFLQRIEATLAILWTMTIFLKVSICLYSFVLGLSQLFRVKNEQSLFFPVGLILYFFTIIFTPNIVTFNSVVTDQWALMDYVFGLLMPLTIMVVYYFRKKMEGVQL